MAHEFIVRKGLTVAEGNTTLKPLAGTGTRITTASSTGVLGALANGTDGYVLTMVSGSPAWAASSGGGGGSVGTLDQVLTNGNTSTQTANFGSIGLYDSTDTVYGIISMDNLFWKFDSTFGTSFEFEADVLTGNRTYVVPDIDGTLALQEWVTAQGYITSAPSYTFSGGLTNTSGTVTLGGNLAAGNTNLYLANDSDTVHFQKAGDSNRYFTIGNYGLDAYWYNSVNGNNATFNASSNGSLTFNVNTGTGTGEFLLNLGSTNNYTRIRNYNIGTFFNEINSDSTGIALKAGTSQATRKGIMITQGGQLTFDYYAGTQTRVFTVDSSGNLTALANGTGVLTNNGSGTLTWGSAGTTLNGTGFVKASGTTITYDNSTYLTAVTGSNLDNVFSANGLLKRTGAGTYTVDTNTYLTGNQTITLSGDVSGSGTTAITTSIGANKVTNAMLAQAPANTLRGNNTAGTANVTDLTGTQVTAILDTFTSTLKGLVPASGGGTTNFLRADGTWAAVSSGSGTVNSGTANQLAFYSATGTEVSGTTLTFSSTNNSLTINGGMVITNGWIDMPTSFPTGIGTGGYGSNLWIGYTSTAAYWFNNALVGDVCYRNASGKRILFGIDNGAGTANSLVVIDGNAMNLLEQSSSPATPASGYGKLYAKTDGKMYFKNDGGTEYDLTGRPTQMSITTDASGLKLVNDVATPGLGYFYGTDAALGTRGWQLLNTTAVPESGSSLYFTNARAQSAVHRVSTLADAATVTPNSSTTDIVILTFTSAVGNTRAIANPTGTPYDGQRLEFRLKQDTTGSRTVTWGTNYRFGTDITSTSLTTTASKTDYVLFQYNAADSKWDCKGLIHGF